MKNKLREIREKNGITQLELADLMDTKQATISKWELGRSTPKPYQMQRLEDYFKVPKELIFFDAFNYKMLLKNNI